MPSDNTWLLAYRKNHHSQTGEDGVVGKILEANKPNFGFDAQNETYVDLVEAGIIDPVKVVRTALQDAASVASLILTTEASVAEAPKKETHSHGMPPGGMGGGMDF